MNLKNVRFSYKIYDSEWVDITIRDIYFWESHNFFISYYYLFTNSDDTVLIDDFEELFQSLIEKIKDKISDELYTFLWGSCNITQIMWYVEMIHDITNSSYNDFKSLRKWEWNQYLFEELRESEWKLKWSRFDIHTKNLSDDERDNLESELFIKSYKLYEKLRIINNIRLWSNIIEKMVPIFRKSFEEWDDGKWKYYNNFLDLIKSDQSTEEIANKSYEQSEDKAHELRNINFKWWRQSLSNLEWLYFDVKINKISWKISKKWWQWYIALNDYFQSIYFNEKRFNIEDFVNLIYSNLNDTEKDILKYRLWWMWQNNKLTLEEISTNTGITGERIRQIEKDILEKFKWIFSKFSETKIWETFTENKLTDYQITNFWLINCKNEVFWNWTSNFLMFIISAMLSSKYTIIEFEDNWTLLLFIEQLFPYCKKIFASIDKIYLEKRIEDEEYSYNEMIDKCLKHNHNSIDDSYEPIIINYINLKYWITFENWKFIFPRNKKDLVNLVKKELDIYGNPIHFKDMLKIVSEKYPWLKRNEGKVHAALAKVWKNVWKWLYVPIGYEMQWWDIMEIAENYLREQMAPVTWDELIEYVQKNKFVKEWSIKSMILSQDKQNKFCIFDKKVALTEWELTYNFDENETKAIEEMKRTLTKDYYPIEYIENVMRSYWIPTKKYHAVISSVWFNMNTWYILSKKFKTINQYLEYKITKNPILHIDKDLINNLIYKRISDKCREFQLYKVNDNTYISHIKLEENWINEDYIKNFFVSLKNRFSNSDYFSIKQVKEELDISKIENLWFDDSFLENIIFFGDWISTIRINNHRLFSYKMGIQTINDFIENELNKVKVTTLYSFIDNLNKTYGLDLDYDIIKVYISRLPNIYYNQILDKVYCNKQDFYNEVYGNDGN